MIMIRKLLIALATAAALTAAWPASATDSTDAQLIANAIDNPAFQERCRLRFINSAIAVVAEVIPLTTNGATAAGNNVLHFASTTGILQGMTPTDLFGAAILPAGTVVETTTATTVTLNNNAAGAGVASGDVINFAPVNHAQRNAFAGALFAGNVDLKMLAMVMLANATNRTNLLANTTVVGGNIADSDLDFQANSTFGGIALSRSW